MPDTKPGTLGQALKSPLAGRAVSFMAYITALGTLLDVLTTLIGLSRGGQEIFAESIAIMNVVGVTGWVLLRIGMATVYVLVGAGFRVWWNKFPPPLCLVFLVGFATDCVITFSPVLFNLGQLLPHP